MTTFQLFIDLIGRLGIFAIILIFLLRFTVVKKLITGRASRREKLMLAALFGTFGIAGTYLGVPVQNAIANSRVVGVAMGGILGGPFVGFVAGLLAGGHRFLIDIGGFTAIACGIATVVEGLAGGFLYHQLKRRPFDAGVAFFSGIVVEVIQMLIILLLAKPFDAALNLVKLIAGPMIVVNSVGLAVFVEMVASVSREQERIGAYQAQTALKIALRTLPYLRSGLNERSAGETARIILEMTDLDAVAITDETKILAHAGAEEDHHKAGDRILTSATKKALHNGTFQVPSTKSEIGCTYVKCRLGSAIIVPLNRRDKTVGALKMYRIKENGISVLDMELANGLAHLFSNQLELADVENQRKLVADAEIRALQSQIKPHFLFNAINTIVSYTRTDPKTASELLLKLAEFFRKNINPGTENVPLSTELEHCKAYMAIETARFEDRVSVGFEVDNAALDCRVPPLILQPLVENALKHGILPKEEGGCITINARRDNGFVSIAVADDGVGMTAEHLAALFSERSQTRNASGAGIALKNVKMRLTALYGNDHRLKIESTLNKGTIVSFVVPA
ncbi:MAG TPA: sensor histidine kinase [Nitrospirota bacterium]|nr:sensor histidine kinase [Nitrospirota bacterium]